jgi:putative ABC transport system substrate-binding protein
MDRRSVVLAAAAAIALPLRAGAQAGKPPRVVGFLSSGNLATTGPWLEEFRAGLRAEGLVEGRDIRLELRWADNRLERLPVLIQELLALKPAVIVTHGSPPVAELKKATSAVPVVFASAGDPVGQGFVQSFRRPGGNITGVAFSEEINKKIYEVARDVLPTATRFATMVNDNNPAQKHHAQDIRAMSELLKFESVLIPATRAEEIEPAMEAAVKARAQALVVSTLAPFYGLRKQIVALQFKYRMPTFHGFGDAVVDGAVGSYSFPFEDSFRRSGVLAAQILRGRDPAEIPVELPTRFEISINLRSAETLGITVPQAALLRANKVIR